MLARYGLSGVDRLSDPDRSLYRAFALRRGGLKEFVNGRNLQRLGEAMRSGHRAGKPMGDVRQMPGTFVVRDGRIVQAFRNDVIGDRPDYLGMLRAE